MGFTAATGEPVLCVVIFQSENQESIPFHWATGIDVSKLYTTFHNEKDGVRFLNSSQGKGNVLPFGPECIFRGKRVPCLIQWSKHGGVTATILTNCLRHMD